MADFRKLGKGVTGAFAQAKQLAAAEREANLQKMLEPSAVKMRLYHGTTATEGGKGQEAIRRIKPSKEGALGSGVYMTPNTPHASSYTGIPNDEAIALMSQGNDYSKKMADQFMADRAAGTLREGQEGGNMLPVYAQIRNPLIIGQSGRQIDPAAEALINLGMDEESAIKLVEKAFEEKGNIGKQIQSRAQAKGYDGIMQYRGGDLSEVVSYNPNAVKSATGNQGTYDIYSPDLSKADGGKIAKGAMGALKKANEMARAQKAAPNIIIPSKLTELKKIVQQEKGDYGSRRLERAADEIPNLGKLYKEQALKEAFTGDNARALMTMNPKDFERYAVPLQPRFMDKNSTRYTSSGERLDYPEYMSGYLPNVGAFNDVPFLLINKEEQGLPLVPFISGHEGRHRNRVMADKGEETGLVQLLPRAELREPFPRRSQQEYIEALKEELAMTNNMVLPERFIDDFSDKTIRRPAIELPDIYAKGGLAMADGGNVLKGNILAGASWNSLNKTLGNELTTLTGQPTINTSVGGATTADTYKQLMDFINGGGSFDPNATVFLQTGGVDFITGVPREQVKSNIEQIISVLDDQGVNVVLTGAPYAASMDDVINNNFDPRIDPIFEEIAAAHPNVALVDSMGDILQDKSLLSDSLHTNETGTRRYNDDVIGALTALQQRQDQAQVQGGREAATSVPQEVERITQPSIEQETTRQVADPIKQDFKAVISQAEDPVIEQQAADPIKQEFQEAITQTETPKPADVSVDVEDPIEQVAVEQSSSPSAPDYSRAYDALGGADVVNNLRDQLLGMGIDESIIAESFSKYYPNEYQPEFAQEQYKRGGKVLHMADAGRVSRGVTGALTKAAEMAKAKKASESKIAEMLEAQQAPMTRPQGTGLPLMPRDQGMYTPREQKDLPRMPTVDKARAAGKSPKYNERMQDLLDSPTARKKVDSLINKGKDLDMKEWYGTEPLRQVAMDAGRTPEQFESLMAQLASASQRNPVDKQNQMGSYLYHLSETGQLPENSLLLTNKLKKALKEDPSLAEGRQLVELPKGYGSLAQGDIFNRAVMIGQGNIGEALPPNKKLGTFYENLLGNLQPVTVDVNAVRGPIIERGDPRWLTSKLVEKDETGKVTASYKPREMFDTGEMTMREAKQRPGFWEAAPSGSEYAGFEDLWQRGAKRHGVAPAEAQALGWYGSADVTALKTKPENYVDNLERLIKRTAEQTGKSPTEVMNDMVTGKGFLRKEGGAVDRKEDMAMKMADLRLTEMVNKRLGMAQGGKVSIFDAPAKRMAGGGSSSEPTAKEVAEQLGKLAVDQGKEEYESYKKPRAATDIGNRGILAPALGAPVDLMNMGLMAADYIGSKATGKPIRLSSEKPFGGQEHIKDLMDKYGVTSGEDRPLTETILSLFSPTGMIKGAMGATKGAVKAADAMRKPASGLGAMREKAN